MSTKKLQIVTPIVTSVNGETGDVTINSVEYTEQTLTDEQKSQARENIQAADALNGFIPYECIFKPWAGTNDIHQTYYFNCKFYPINYRTAPEEVATAWGQFQWIVTSKTNNIAAYKNKMRYMAVLAKAGVFGDDYLSAHEFGNRIIIQTSPFDPEFTVIIYFATSPDSIIMQTKCKDGYNAMMEYYMDDDSFYEYPTYHSSYLYPSQGMSEDAPMVNQFYMRANPTSDMQVATKKYVDEHGGTQPDWNQNDDSAPDYIKNRVCYKEEVPEEIIAEWCPNGSYIKTFYLKKELVPDQSYTVYLDSNTVTSIATYYDGSVQLNLGKYLPNISAGSVDQPADYPNSPAVWNGPPSGVNTYKIAIPAHAIYHQIPKEFVNYEGLATKNYVDDSASTITLKTWTSSDIT